MPLLLGFRGLSNSQYASSASACLLRFAENRRGVITVLYALLAIPILGLLFGGIDYSRALSVQSQFQTAAEAAARTAASRLHEGRSQAAAAFRVAFQTNLPPDLKDHPYNLDIAGDAKSLSVEFTASVPTTLVALLGFSKIDVAAGFTANRPEPTLFARRKAYSNSLDAVPTDGAGARTRAKLEAAIRRSGGQAAKFPDPDEIEKARSQMRKVLRAMGQTGQLPRSRDVPDAAKLERMQRQINLESGRLRF